MGYGRNGIGRALRRGALRLGMIVLAGAYAAGAADVLLINGNSNNTVQKGGLSLGDAFVKERLERVLGHRTRVLWDETPKAEMRAAADSSGLVVVLESVTSAFLTDKLRATSTPILNCEAFIQDDLGLTATGPSGDPGPPSRFALGVMDGQTAIDIKDPLHPLAAGLRDRVTIYRLPKQVNWGKLASGARVVATLAGDSAGASVYTYPKGGKLFDGTSAAGLRVGFFLEDDNVTGTPNLLTAEGLRLLDAAVRFALEDGSVGMDAPPAKPGWGIRPRDGESGRADALGRLNAPGKSDCPGAGRTRVRLRAYSKS